MPCGEGVVPRVGVEGIFSLKLLGFGFLFVELVPG